MNPTLVVVLAVLAALGVGAALFASFGPEAGGASETRPQRAQSREGSPRARTGTSLADRLAAAGIKLHPSEFRAIQLGVALLLGLAAGLRFGSLVAGLVLAIVGWFAPIVFLQLRRGRLRAVINQQLSETLITLSNSLKAGLNLQQAVDAVARSGYHPMSDEFARVVREMAMGATMDQALTNLVRRTRNDDLELAVTAILIHNTIGGNLASVLDSIERTLRIRAGIASELATLTAQTRASAWVITLLPFGVGALLLFIAPTYFSPMIQSDLGKIILGLCLLSILVGNVLIRRAIRVEV